MLVMYDLNILKICARTSVTQEQNVRIGLPEHIDNDTDYMKNAIISDESLTF